jgi:hypothetical protein
VNAVRSLVTGLVVGTLALACDAAPTAPPSATPPAFLSASRWKSSDTTTTTTTTTSLPQVGACPQAGASLTQVIGPAGGQMAVGPHVLWVAAGALSAPVSITAVAPADTVRWVRFQPDGLVFQPTALGVSALVYTSYAGCSVPTTSTPRIAQVSDSLTILGYLPVYVQTKKNNQYAIGVLQHFSNYAVAW